MDLAKIAPGRHAFQRCPCGASIIWGDLATEEEIAAYEAEHAPHVARLLARLSAVPVEIFAWFEGGRLVQIEAAVRRAGGVPFAARQARPPVPLWPGARRRRDAPRGAACARGRPDPRRWGGEGGPP